MGCADTPAEPPNETLETQEIEFDRVRTNTWVLMVPSGWTENPQENGSLYFEAPDGERGFYITTWNLSEESFTSPNAAIQSFYATSNKSLHQMEGQSWSEVDKHSASDAGRAVLVVDYLSAEGMYRIVEKYIAREGTLVRAAFHDYYCDYYDNSRQAFEPIISSLSFVD